MSYKLGQDYEKLLEKLAKKEDRSQLHIIRRALKKYAKNKKL